MKKTNIKINYKKREIKISVFKVNYLEKFIGLMFKKRKNSRILLFEFKNKVNIPFHSLFVFYPFLVIWLDEKNNVIDKKVTKPFKLKIKPKKEFKRVIEIPLNQKYKKILKLLDED